jgi:hypothetical protein
MKPYIQGLITGILLTVSAMMFMGAQDPRLDRNSQYYVNINIMDKLEKIERYVYDTNSIVGMMKLRGVKCK